MTVHQRDSVLEGIQQEAAHGTELHLDLPGIVWNWLDRSARQDPEVAQTIEESRLAVLSESDEDVEIASPAPIPACHGAEEETNETSSPRSARRRSRNSWSQSIRGSRKSLAGMLQDASEGGFGVTFGELLHGSALVEGVGIPLGM